MTTDCELLEGAARAAGIVGCFEQRLTGNGLCVSQIGPLWNPLTDDGDRYRLAKIIGMSIDFVECTVWKRLDNYKLIQEYWGEGTGNDEAHAIVRAAFEISLGMP